MRENFLEFNYGGNMRNQPMKEKDKASFKRGDKVIATNQIGVEYRRIFSHFNQVGVPMCYYYGADEWASEGRVTPFLKIRHPTTKEL